MKFILSKNDFDFTKFAVKTSNVGRWEDCDLSESIQGVSYLGQLFFTEPISILCKYMFQDKPVFEW